MKKTTNKHWIKTSCFILLFLTSTPVFPQKKIVGDFDLDNIPDTISLQYQGDTVSIESKLSSNNFKPIYSQKLTETKGLTFNLHSQKNIIFLQRNDGHSYKYIEAKFQYNKKQTKLLLVGLSRYQARDNLENGAGQSFLDLQTKKYKGKWSYYDFFEENPDDYRIYMPEINTTMDFKQVDLAHFNAAILDDFQKQCMDLYENQLAIVLPEGNSQNGILYADINNDLEPDKIYFDPESGRIRTELLTSKNIFFTAEYYKIIPLGDHFLLKSMDGDSQEVEFSVSNKAIQILEPSSWKNKDLDHDGKIDFVKIKWNEGAEKYKSKITVKLSSQNFKKIETDFIFNRTTTLSDTNNGFKVNIGFTRNVFSARIRYNKSKKSLQIIGADYFQNDKPVYSLNLLTNDFIGRLNNSNHQSKIKLKYATLQDISHDYIDKYLSKCEQELND